MIWLVKEGGVAIRPDEYICIARNNCSSKYTITHTQFKDFLTHVEWKWMMKKEGTKWPGDEMTRGQNDRVQNDQGTTFSGILFMCYISLSLSLLTISLSFSLTHFISLSLSLSLLREKELIKRARERKRERERDRGEKGGRNIIFCFSWLWCGGRLTSPEKKNKK
jgi:hypothetical protein